MSYLPHIKIAFGGKLNGSGDAPEIWECAVNADIVAGGALADFDYNAYLAAIQASLAAWFSAGTSGIANTATLEYVKANEIGADGKYASATTTNVYDYAAPSSGGQAAINPEIISLCTSWATAKKRGPGSHGRIYLPNFTFGPSSSMTVTSASAQTAATAGAALLNLLAAPAGALQLRMVVASNVDASLTTITTVRVGNIKDVQRRRKSALKEVYQTAPV